MDDRSLIEYISGNANQQTTDLVEGWIMQSDENMQHFIKVKDEYIYSTLPNMPASDKQMQIAEGIIKQQTKNRKIEKLHYITLGAVAIFTVALFTNMAIMLHRSSYRVQDENLPAQRIVFAEFPKPYTHTIYTNKGTRGEVILPDSSVVKLNSDTKITFPDKFIGPTREVFITGEAYFKVKPNPDTPMVVSTNRNIVVKVLGTEFNLRAYENETTTRTTLYSGKVDVLGTKSDGETFKLAELKPNESYVTREAKAPLKVLKADTLKIAAWRNGVLIFDNTPMDAVIKELERWHGASITVRNDKLYKYTFTAKFNQEPLVRVLESIKFCTDIKYTIDGNEVVFY